MLPDAPLTFTPVYKTVLWGGRRLARWRPALPAGPIGESWELADHPAGMSVVAGGPLAGASLRDLVARFGAALVGDGFTGGPFPLMVKLIDATERLSVQVHPGDALARSLGVADHGKTECWLVLEDGGDLFVGARPGVDRPAFERALASGAVEATLVRHEARAGDCFFLAAGTVHALGAGCLVYELQQPSDVTFRVHDWNRVGADGKPRPLHVEEALATIDFARQGAGPRRPGWHDERGARRRTLVDCPYFRLDELELAAGETSLPLQGACAVLTALAGSGRAHTPGGAAALAAGQTQLIPAAAGSCALSSDGSLRLLVATPRL
jgi:mannose-6-phosphate isomerase